MTDLTRLADTTGKLGADEIIRALRDVIAEIEALPLEMRLRQLKLLALGFDAILGEMQEQLKSHEGQDGLSR